MPMVVSVGLLAYLLQQFPPTDVLKRADPLVLLGAMLLSLVCNFGFGILRWSLLLRLAGCTVPWANLCRVWIGLYPLSALMPMQSGHLLYIPALRSLGGLRWRDALLLTALDKALNITALGLLVMAKRI